MNEGVFVRVHMCVCCVGRELLEGHTDCSPTIASCEWKVRESRVAQSHQAGCLSCSSVSAEITKKVGSNASETMDVQTR